MPIYEFVCNKCNCEFEYIVFGEDKIVCPQCMGKDVYKIISTFNMGKNTSSIGENYSTHSDAGCTSCGSKKCGSCSH